MPSTLQLACIAQISIFFGPSKNYVRFLQTVKAWISWQLSVLSKETNITIT